MTIYGILDKRTNPHALVRDDHRPDRLLIYTDLKTAKDDTARLNRTLRRGPAIPITDSYVPVQLEANMSPIIPD